MRLEFGSMTRDCTARERRSPRSVWAAVRRFLGINRRRLTALFEGRRAATAAIGAIALLLVGALAVPATAQDATRFSGTAIDRYLPSPDALGAGWRLTHVSDPEPAPDLFRAGAKVVYGGPNGARAVLFVWTLTGERTAPQAWAGVSQLTERYRVAFAAEAGVADPIRLHGPAPAGCAAATRAEGIDPASEFGAGLTLCAVGSEAIVLAVVSGDLGPSRGVEASDHLVALSLATAAVMATPVGTPAASRAG